MEQQELTILLDKYLTGELSPEERVRLAELAASPGSDEVLEKFVGAVMTNEEVGDLNDPVIAASILGFLEKRMKPVRHRITYMRWMAAAVVLGLLAGGVWFWQSRGRGAGTAVAASIVHDVAPGQEGAILTLADGKQIVLDSSENGSLGTQGEAAVVKQGAAQLTYQPAAATVEKNVAEFYNTLTTPRGRRASVVLSDGTKVWLNAGSSIRFPTVFHGMNRGVGITGEAYFEVARDQAHPFLVTVNRGVQVEVLGTSFNINAYNDEKEVVTTLVQGAVKVKSGQDSLLLHPGMQALSPDNGVIRKETEVDLQKVTAWKDGYFFFKSDELSVIMRQLSRWYDIDIHFDGTVSDHYTGKISRQVNISQVLKMLQAAGGVGFSVNDREVRIAPRGL
jgi:transmembrane sensor